MLLPGVDAIQERIGYSLHPSLELLLQHRKGKRVQAWSDVPALGELEVAKESEVKPRKIVLLGIGQKIVQGSDGVFNAGVISGFDKAVDQSRQQFFGGAGNSERQGMQVPRAACRKQVRECRVPGENVGHPAATCVYVSGVTFRLRIRRRRRQGRQDCF